MYIILMLLRQVRGDHVVQLYPQKTSRNGLGIFPRKINHYLIAGESNETS